MTDQQPAAAAPTPEQRQCIKCNERKVVSPETWPYRKQQRAGATYSAHGATCLACERKRKAEYEARRDKIAKLVAEIPADPAAGDKSVATQQKTALASSKLDVAKALKAGSKVLNEYAASVLARVLEAFEDPDSPRHDWAVTFLAERILPRKLYEELGGQAAGVGSLQDKRPVFIVQVLPATPTEPGRVIEGEKPQVLLTELDKT